MFSTLTDNLPMLLTGTGETLYITMVSALFAYGIGLPLGLVLIATAKGGIRPNALVCEGLGWVVNIGRSIPFIILILAISPLTKLLVGKSYGPSATIVPLVIAAAPFVARLTEQSFAEIDRGVIEAARTMGATDLQILFKVILPESVPSLVRGGAVTLITLIGYSAMAGAVGGGGLGDIAIRYGYHRYEYDVMLLTVVLLILLVQVVQVLFGVAAKLLDHRKSGS